MFSTKTGVPSRTVNFREHSIAWSRYQYLALTLITVIAAGLRFYNLGEWGFWGDEIITFRRAQTVLDLGIKRWSLTNVSIHYAMLLFKETEWAARFVPALLGSLTIPILYWPARAFAGSFAALVFCLLLSVSTWHLYWSQNARFYVALLLFYNLALFALYYAIEEDRPVYIGVGLLFFALAVLERQVGMFLIPVFTVYLVAAYLLPFDTPKGFRLRNLGLLLLPAVLLVLLLFTTDFAGQLNPESWQAQFGFANNTPFWILAGVTYYMGLPVVLIGGLGTLYLLQRRQRLGLFLGVSAILPLLVILVLAPFHYTATRYVFICLPSWLLLTAIVAVELVRRIRHQPTSFLVAGVLLLLVLEPVSEDILYYRYQNGNRDDWKGAFAFIERHKQPGDLVVAGNPAVGEYYLGHRPLGMQSVKPQDLIEQHRGRIWFVEDMTMQDKAPEVRRWVRQNTTLVSVLDVSVRARTFTMRVYLYEPDVTQESVVAQ